MTTAFDIHSRFQNELPYFSSQALIIKDKSGAIIPFVFNSAQEYLHKRLEQQIRTFGRVRALILKGRQQGCSTYVSGRFYHKTTRLKGKSAFILSHESKTTRKLFAIVERFHTRCPIPLRPETDTESKQQLVFAKQEGDYSVGTAGNEDVGRGGTLQYFHGSEVAFWENTDGIETGIMQSVADLPGTEIILESTANGPGNMFYQKCMDALEGKGDYILVFIPWYWQPEYSRETPANFELTDDELLLKTQFDLTNEQVYWRRKKVEELRSVWKFRQEYPMTVQDAFVTSGNSLINGDKIVEARKSNIKDPTKPLILGVDPGRTKDPAIIAFRRGREFSKFIKFDKHSQADPLRQTHMAGRLATIIDRENVAMCFIDVAHGYGVIDILTELGYGKIVRGVHFNEGTLFPELYLNKRSEILIAIRDWIEEGGVSVPDDEEVQMDLGTIPDYRQTSNQRMYIISKDEIKEKYGKTTHIADALALTFAYPVKCGILTERQRIRKGENRNRNGGPLRTLNRTRAPKKDNYGVSYIVR